MFDPIFQGMAVSLMAGEVASLLLSRAAIPVFTYLLHRRQEEFSLEITASAPQLEPWATEQGKVQQPILRSTMESEQIGTVKRTEETSS